MGHFMVRWAALLGVLAPIMSDVPRAASAAEPAKAALQNRFEHVHALTMDADGQTLWLGAHTGLFRSQDRGETWTGVALPVTHAHLDVMAVAGDPRDAKVLYVGTHEGGVQDARWGCDMDSCERRPEGPDVHGLAVDPREPLKLHAAVRGPGEGVYRTTDGGEKWVRVDDGPAGEVKVLASVNILTGMGGIFLYGGTAEGLLRSPDCF
jgi:photosystem II stability/assembly factor-like uncharacterized protein